ncbi:MAG TPA: hypothetical protein VF665_01635, partial [Longimicrobium sp.]
MNRRTTLGAIEARLEREGLLRPESRLSTADAAREVDDVTGDSRAAKAGTLFCAVVGTASDSHRFLPAVAESGAAGATVERADASIPIPQIAVTDGRRATAFAAAEFFGDPWAQMTLV